jgi:hypothetical protein
MAAMVALVTACLGLTSGGTWGVAHEVPGTAALNKGGNAQIESLSCPSDGNCGAGGYYWNASGKQEAFAVSEADGRWGSAREILGPAIPSRAGYAAITSVSCAAPGDCAAGGYYENVPRSIQAFVVDETDGIWGVAEEVPGTAALNQGGYAMVNSVSCGSVGNCGAGGSYIDGGGLMEGFVVSEVDGTWTGAQEIPGTGVMNQGEALISTVSCASAGNCTAGGSYFGHSTFSQAFVLGETDGTWGVAQQIPGLVALNQGGATTVAVSCAPAGDCSAGGYYENGFRRLQAFVATETGGTWGTAREVPGTATLNRGGNAEVDSVSCASAGDCTAGGHYQDGSDYEQAFVVTQTGGTWGTAREVPGTATLNRGDAAEVDSVSCASAGNCSAGGQYRDRYFHLQVFVVNETNGVWGRAEEVPGTATLNKFGQAMINSVSCAPAGDCSAGGYYQNGSEYEQAFVVNESGPPVPIKRSS